ncbi:MAG: SH3 domain-containing protein [Brevirhabdus sp.]
MVQSVLGTGDQRRAGLTHGSSQIAASAVTEPPVDLTITETGAPLSPTPVETLSLRNGYDATHVAVPAIMAATAPTVVAEAVEVTPDAEIIEVTEIPVAQDASGDEPDVLWEVKASRVNVRQGPSTRYSVLTKLSRGDKADVIEILDNGWAFIRLSDGKRGYLSSQFLVRSDQQG